MAAGRKSVLLKRESFQYSCSIKKSDHYTNVSSLVELGGLLGGQEEKEQGEIYFEHGDKALPPPGKKRKLSPIVWDLSEKETRISSKSRVSQVAAVSPNSSSGLPQEHSQNCNQDGVEESEAKKWNISMSRWASDGLSPVGVDDKNKQAKGSSSHEVDESQSDCSESTITRSIGSSGRYRGDHDLGPSTGDADFEKEFLIDSVDDVEEQDDASDSPSGSHGLMHVQRNINMHPSCRSVCEFEMIKKINEGTYGVVYKARDKKTGEIVALKKVKMNMERDGFPLSSLREINILSSFNHPSIVDVKEVVVDDYDGTFMVMEYMEHDLKGLMEVKKHPFSIGEIKYLMLQLLEGVKYLHDNWVLHRDLKTSNILLNKEGDLKICDFGMSRQYGSPRKPYTPVVVTLWYRAPELLLGSKEYSTAVDMWSVGCIMAELVSKEPLFRGKTELEQLDKIFRTLGTPEEKIWPGLSKLPGSKANFVKQPYNMLRKKFPAASFTGSPVLSELGLDLLNKLLTHDPEKRITAEVALLHDWFREAPLPKSDFKPILPWRC